MSAYAHRLRFESPLSRVNTSQGFSCSQVDPSLSQPAIARSHGHAGQLGLSQHILSPRRGNTTLPRLPRLPREHTTQVRRKAVNSAVHDYFMSLNSIARSIVLETETVEKEHNTDWPVMNDSSREDIVNEHFVPTGIRSQYDDSFIGDWHRSPVIVYHNATQGPLRLSQPSDWEVDSLAIRNYSTSQGTEELSLSQPSSYSYEQPNGFGSPATVTYIQPTSKLHKRQLSFSRQNVIRPEVHYLPPPRENLGSDGESPRTSDEDCGNPLGFERTRLRSLSMRPKRGSAKCPNVAARSSLRYNHSTQPMTPDRTVYTEEHSRPSHYDIRSTHYNNAEPIYDGEVDLPDEALLLDHIQGPSNESSPLHTAIKPPRYSRTRRSQRGLPKLLIDQSGSETLVIPNRHPSESSSSMEENTDSTSSLTCNNLQVFSSGNQTEAEVIPNPLRVTSPFSSSLNSLLDIDTDSIAPSTTHTADDEDDVMSEQSRMTPDSMLSVSSFSSRQRSKPEMAVMRNRRGKRGGSSYRTTTSEFADRHAQFKPNMLRKQKLGSAQNSPCPTRESTPAPSATHEDALSQGDLLKPPHLTLPTLSSKHNSLAESVTSDLPRSPDHLSSPPQTPLVHTASMMQCKKEDSRRESGYLSSSSESFAIRR